MNFKASRIAITRDSSANEANLSAQEDQRFSFEVGRKRSIENQSISNNQIVLKDEDGYFAMTSSIQEVSQFSLFQPKRIAPDASANAEL